MELTQINRLIKTCLFSTLVQGPPLRQSEEELEEAVLKTIAAGDVLQKGEGDDFPGVLDEKSDESEGEDDEDEEEEDDEGDEDENEEDNEESDQDDDDDDDDDDSKASVVTQKKSEDGKSTTYHVDDDDEAYWTRTEEDYDVDFILFLNPAYPPGTGHYIVLRKISGQADSESYLLDEGLSNEDMNDLTGGVNDDNNEDVGEPDYQSGEENYPTTFEEDDTTKVKMSREDYEKPQPESEGAEEQGEEEDEEENVRYEVFAINFKESLHGYISDVDPLQMFLPDYSDQDDGGDDDEEEDSDEDDSEEPDTEEEYSFDDEDSDEEVTYPDEQATLEGAGEGIDEVDDGGGDHEVDDGGGDEVDDGEEDAVKRRKKRWASSSFSSEPQWTDCLKPLNLKNVKNLSKHGMWNKVL